SLQDGEFPSGQENDAPTLGDQLTKWLPVFRGKQIHGVILLASDTDANIQTTLANIQTSLDTSIKQIYNISGAARPGSQAGHERIFGYLDGISQPGLQGFTTTPLPGQQVVAPGLILAGQDGDITAASRPAWTTGGSFLVFRQLRQLVPEFNKFVQDNALTIPGLTHQQGSDLLGARLIGRWKSGAPIDLTPMADDPTLGADPQRNNNFNFTHPGSDILSDQSHCPFAAHIRKVSPRADITVTEATKRRIMRSSIPYGPEGV
ncbi:hypothetical protein M422DRAFT_261266, partial [Sphaerobolus stellatus SS14]